MLWFMLRLERLVCVFRGHDTYTMAWCEYHSRTGNWIEVHTIECARCFFQRRPW